MLGAAIHRKASHLLRLECFRKELISEYIKQNMLIKHSCFALVFQLPQSILNLDTLLCALVRVASS